MVPALMQRRFSNPDGIPNQNDIKMTFFLARQLMKNTAVS
jgi:hypothetical protein